MFTYDAIDSVPESFYRDVCVPDKKSGQVSFLKPKKKEVTL